MSGEERRLDKVVSGVSEAGYVELAKWRLGFRLGDPELWKVEGGWEAAEDKARVDEVMHGVEDANERGPESFGKYKDNVVFTIPANKQG
jgi:hypothetical protein